jgi:hypothetical protein
LRDEIAHRTNQKKQIEANHQHQAELGQGKNLHVETMVEIGKLKTSVDLVKSSVDHLARPRWIDWAILIVGAIAAVGVIISLFLIH